LHKTAAERGGKLISTSVKNTEEKLLWECANGHRWMAKSSNIRSGKWCPDCLRYLGESIVRAVLEGLTGHSFPKQKPDWLRNPATGRKLELDGYSASLGLAFEHHGQHHYEAMKLYLQDEKALDERRNLDALKLDQCKAQGIDVLVVPLVPDLTSLHDLEKLIKDFLGSHSVEYNDLSINDMSFEHLYHAQDLTKLRELVSQRGGEVLTPVFLGTNSKMRFGCNQGHQWEATPYKIRSGQWCRVCAGLTKGTIEDMRTLARANGGDCLSEEYVSGHHNLQWRCSKGHEWLAPAISVKNRGSWCKVCAGLARLTIEDMRTLAESRGGLCLSTTYKNKEEKLLWRCEDGHEWWARGGSVKRGTWCAICYRSRRSRE
jgi:hypothetical protein